MLRILKVRLGWSSGGGWFMFSRTGFAPVCLVMFLAGLVPVVSAQTINVDTQLDRHPISPDVYGANLADQATLQAFNIPLHRLGGNRMSRYNWADNSDATGSFWYFESYPDPDPTPGGIADSFIQLTKSGGAQPMMTVPMIDWITKADAMRHILCSFDKSGTPAYTDQTLFDPFQSNCGTGVKQSDGTFVVNNPATDLTSFGTKAAQANDAALQAAFVQHLIDTWGAAGIGGVTYYILDNEYSDWHAVHRDVHPTGASYQEIKDKMILFGEMIRAKDANAQILATEEVGWWSFYYSGRDLQSYDLNGTTPDYTGHGNTFYTNWLLDQIHQHDVANPTKRVLDVFSMHWYPSGNEFSNDVDPASQLLRNRSTRALWDPNYTDENGLLDPLTGNPAQPDFIHRMQNAVATYYPGLKTAITEYSWGAVDDMNGATAQADVLGILGREGVDIGTAWFDETLFGGMHQSQPAAKAFAMYRNYDGSNSTFGDTNIRATVPNPDNVSAFAAERSADGALTIVVINKQLSSTASITVNLANFQDAGAAQVYQLAGNVISHPANRPIAASSFTASLPAKSVTTFVIPPLAAAPNFSVSCAPTSLFAAPGGSDGSSCSVTPTGGFNNDVTLSCAGLPAGITCSFGTNPVTPPGSSTLTVNVDGAVAEATYPFTVQGTDGVLTHSSNMSIVVSTGPAALLYDDFEDNNMTWIAQKGVWTESGGTLTGVGASTAIVFAPQPWSPSGLSACSVCTLETDITTSGGINNKVFIQPWYQSKTNRVDLLLKPDNGVIILKQVSGGVLVRKSKFFVALPHFTNHHIKLGYDGANFNLEVDGVPQAAVSAGAVPFGNLSLKVKNTTATLQQVIIY